jgi:hypothetical protein
MKSERELSCDWIRRRDARTVRFDDALMTVVTRAQRLELVLVGGTLGVQHVAHQAGNDYGDEGLDPRLRGQTGVFDFVELADVLDRGFGFLGERFDGLLLFCRITCGIAQDGHGSSEVGNDGSVNNGAHVN